MGGIRPPTRASGPDDMATCATGFFYKPYTDSWPSSRPHAAIQTEGERGEEERRHKGPFCTVQRGQLVLQLDTTLHQREVLDREAQLREHQIRARKGHSSLCACGNCLEGKLLGGGSAFLNGFLDTRKEFFYRG